MLRRSSDWEVSGCSLFLKLSCSQRDRRYPAGSEPRPVRKLQAKQVKMLGSHRGGGENLLRPYSQQSSELASVGMMVRVNVTPDIR